MVNDNILTRSHSALPTNLKKPASVKRKTQSWKKNTKSASSLRAADWNCSSTVCCSIKHCPEPSPQSWASPSEQLAASAFVPFLKACPRPAEYTRGDCSLLVCPKGQDLHRAFPCRIVTVWQLGISSWAWIYLSCFWGENIACQRRHPNPGPTRAFSSSGISLLSPGVLMQTATEQSFTFAYKKAQSKKFLVRHGSHEAQQTDWLPLTYSLCFPDIFFYIHFC